ncbi:Swt1 family HEPN domain-containing protein [Methylocapsa acidiphila]|uniref:Swt1 family HEPN domain-containing protein n=1 Tax=Methylocapsa acidiphila TaxID=133552 RepID=UPI00047E5DC6|nr:Swt1 family HEPN domain-containing protein [Methylocapsa acidiphila]
MENDWQRRLTEANSFVREHEEQMRRLREFAASTRPFGLDSETLRSIAKMREQANFLKVMQSNPAIADVAAVIRGVTGPGSALMAAKAQAMESHSAMAHAAAAIGKITGPGSAYDLATQSLSEFAKRFRVPEFDEMSRLLPKVQNSIWLQYGLPKSHFETILSGFRQPWLDVRDQLGSLTGVAKLQGIGHLIATKPPFDLDAVSALRIDLGDWRDRINWPITAATDVTVRTALYAERGFNPALTTFPSETFEEGIAGLRSGLPPLVAAYGDPVPRSDDDEEEESFFRNNVIHDWLQRFESQIRRFIDMLMTEHYGSDWPRHQLPNGLYDTWVEKQVKDKSGRDWPLVYYADFTEYELVICKRDNWNKIFGKYFKRQEHVRESLQRLYLPRNATMHARPLMPEDELFVFVEVRRLIKLFYP